MANGFMDKKKEMDKLYLTMEVFFMENGEITSLMALER